MENRSIIWTSIAISGIILMGLWTFRILLIFGPAVFRHLQYPVDLIAMMSVLSCIPAFLCTLGLLFRRPWSLPLAVFLFFYISLINVLETDSVASSVLFQWVIAIILSLSFGLLFAFSKKIKEFFRFPGMRILRRHLSSNKIAFIVSLFIILVLEAVVTRRYLYYQQYPWPPPEIANAAIHKHWSSFVKGDISNRDIEEIVGLVKKQKDIDTRILSVTQDEDGTVKVFTGELIEPLWGFGNELLLKKENNEWRVLSKSPWISSIDLPNKSRQSMVFFRPQSFEKHIVMMNSAHHRM
jgi:hypothetical protein